MPLKQQPRDPPPSSLCLPALCSHALQSFLRQILLAVNHAHMNCVMHRDLKPQNILVDASHTNVKVADFGLARSFLPPFKAYTDKVVVSVCLVHVSSSRPAVTC